VKDGWLSRHLLAFVSNACDHDHVLGPLGRGLDAVTSRGYAQGAYEALGARAVAVHRWSATREESVDSRG
jgi:hypothetical protein